MNLKDKYKKEVAPRMMEKFGYRNVMAVPKIEKVVVNVGFGKIVSQKSSSEEQKKIYAQISEDLKTICGQKAVLTKAKKSIAGFKLRQGVSVGAKVTLRGAKMYDFIERVVAIALPRTRDFRGLDANSVDKKGNLTIGIKEHIVFPEISIESSRILFGFEISVVTTAKNKEEGIEFLKMMGFPIKKQ